jgi:hypothetical protein
MSHNFFLFLRKLGLVYHPSAFLLAAQLLSMFLYAAFDSVPGGRALLGAFGVVVLVLVVWVVNHSPGINWIAYALAILAAVLTLLYELSIYPASLPWAALTEAVLYFYAAGSLTAYMLGDNRVTLDELFAAGATFTLLAWGFAYLYLVCQAWIPGSFAGSLNPDQPWTFLELLSLSFTNLSATGLSDIYPASALARALVMLEQFSGIAYLAVVVSRLVGMTLANQQSRR